MKLGFRKLFVRSTLPRSMKNIMSRLRQAFMIMVVRSKKLPTPEEIMAQLKISMRQLFVIPKNSAIEYKNFVKPK